MNKEYWPAYYNKYQSPIEASDFAQFVNTKIKKGSKIVDIGCGNGRDTQYFEQCGHTVFAVDNVEITNFLGKNLINCDALNLDIVSDVYYSRFFIHTLSENDFDIFLKTISNIIQNGTLFIETRAIDGEIKKLVTFKSPIGEEHCRMLYSVDYLQHKFNKHFKIESISQSNQFAKYKNENPLIIRAILKKK